MKNLKKLVVYVSCFTILILVILLKDNKLITENNRESSEVANDEPPTNECPPVIHYNNDDYRLSKSDLDSWSVDITKLDVLGKITSTVDISELPKKNFETNCNYKDLEIYKYSKDEILIEYPSGSGKYQIFKKTEELKE